MSARQDMPPSVFYVLLALADRPRHGHGIKLDIASRTQGKIVMGPGTLYGTIKRMLRDGLIREASEPADDGVHERRRYYAITEAGRAAAEAEAARMAQLLAVATAKELAVPGADEP